MQCMRRPDLGNLTRVARAVQAFLGMGVYGERTRIAHTYHTSRLFVDTLLWQLLTLSHLDTCAPNSSSASNHRVDTCILWLRLAGECSLDSLSQILRQLGRPFASVGSLSQRLTAYAHPVPQDGLPGARIVLLWCDAIFTLGPPILLTVEPRSLAILTIELAAQRDAETWQNHGGA